MQRTKHTHTNIKEKRERLRVLNDKDGKYDLLAENEIIIKKRSSFMRCTRTQGDGAVVALVSISINFISKAVEDIL